MNRRRRHLLWLPLVLLSVCAGQDQPDIVDTIKRLEGNLPEIRQAADQLARYAPIVKGIGLAILLLGIVAGALSQMESPSKRLKATGWVVGILISTLTAFSSFYFVMDHKTLRFLAQDGRNVAKAIEEDINSYQRALGLNTPEAKTAAGKYLQTIARRQQRLQELEHQAQSGGQTLNVNKEIQFVVPLSTSAARGLPPERGGWFSVYAAEQPGWITKPPYDQYRIGVVGVGAASTAVGAEEAARYNAMETLAAQLRARLPT
jgi:hypothetical protein